jgi:hypothetical protein
MSIRDRNIDWLREYRLIPSWHFSGYGPTPAVTESGTTSHAAGALLPGSDTGAPIIDEISTFGYSACKMDTDGDVLSTYWLVPHDLDPTYEVGFRIWWTSAASGTQTVDWTLKTSWKAAGAALAAASAGAALNTTIAQDAMASTAYGAMRTERGILNSGFLTRQQVEDGAVGLFHVAATDLHTGISAAWLLGLEIDYVPFRTRGTGVASNCPLES